MQPGLPVSQPAPEALQVRCKSDRISCQDFIWNFLIFCFGLLNLMFRLCHYQPQHGGYRCIPCKKVFSTWKIFRRHREQKHGAHRAVSCQHCDYKTTRIDNLPRHVKLNHGSSVMVSSLLQDLIKEVTADRNVPEAVTGREEVEEEEEDGPKDDIIEDLEDGQSLRVRLRNRRVNEIQAEFRKQYPSFDEEVKKLKVLQNTTRLQRRKAPAINGAPRRSSRVGKQDQVQITGVFDEQTGLSNVEHGDVSGQQDVGLQLGDGIVQFGDLNVEHDGGQLEDIGGEQEGVVLEFGDAIDQVELGRSGDVHVQLGGLSIQPGDGIFQDVSLDHGGGGAQHEDLSDVEKERNVSVLPGVNLSGEQEVICVQIVDVVLEHGSVQVADLSDEQGVAGVQVQPGDLSVEQEDICVQLVDAIVEQGGIGENGIGVVSFEHGGGVQLEDLSFVQIEDVSFEYGGVSVEAENLGDEDRDVYVPPGEVVVLNLPDVFLELPGETADEAGGSHLGKYGCVGCSMSFRDLRNLKRHVKLVHELRSIPVGCPRSWCTAEFSILAEMIKHKETCLMMCPYPGCSKGFRREKLFAAHQRGHVVMTRRMM